MPSIAPDRHAAFNPDYGPMIVFVETTRACDLACQHCRACAAPRRHPHELTLHQFRTLLAQLAEFRPAPTVVLTGGDPLKRPDLDEIIRAGLAQGLSISLAPSATPHLTRRVLDRWRELGVSRVALSVDGADSDTHTALRGVPGTFDRAIAMLIHARNIGLSTQVNTTIHRGNAHQVDDMAHLLAPLGPAMWSLFFLIHVGRGIHHEAIAPEDYEGVFDRLLAASHRHDLSVKTTEAPFYRRYALQRGERPSTLGLNDGKGICFISHVGDIQPSGFLPIRCGRFPRDSVVDVYRDHPLMRSLRRPADFEGKCGACRYHGLCGGSRARAYAATRDPLASDPDCLYHERHEESYSCSA